MISKSVQRLRWLEMVLCLSLPGICAGQASPEPREAAAVEETMGDLIALPYASWSEVRGEDMARSGVTVHLSELAQRGINMFKSGVTQYVYLLDMQGRILHRLSAAGTLTQPYRGREFVTVGGRLARIDWKSSIVWERKDLCAHHDVASGDGGRVYTLTHNDTVFPELSEEVPIDDNHIAIFTADGEPIREISIIRMLLASEHADYLRSYVRNRVDQYKRIVQGRAAGGGGADGEKRCQPQGLDALHTNTIEVIPRDVGQGGRKIFQKGNVLISIRKLDTVAVVDTEKESIVWSWGRGVIEAQHQPTLLDNDHILIFDNGPRRKYSRVVEVDVATGEIVWEYVGDPVESFYSFAKGGVERLPNGNTLITDSERGRVFEVTPEKQVVWEFWNGERKGDSRAEIYRFMRITDPEKYPELWDRLGGR